MYRDPDAPVAARLVRCAVYTRKSTDEGLDQVFNSLDAQREACEAYITSQRHEGWSCLPDRYDDGGFSGGTIERPALKRLLADVAAKRIDVIVLYKIDRLTRALSDFARIVDVLDKAGASFVSITQSFNTTTSMGRLTLNVLLSFAQFEREVGAERVRDKIAASKKKGMWMGGVPPLGYDVQDRALVVNEPEANIVRDIFARYLELGSVRALQVHLARCDIRAKRRTSRNGRTSGGGAFTPGALYVLLKNVLYVGEVSHRGTPYPGQQAAIIDREIFDRVQSLLAENRSNHTLAVSADEPSLLAGLVWDGQGRRMSPRHTTKGPRRYRYYASRTDEPDHQDVPAVRVPAADLESVVVARMVAFLRDPRAIVDVVDAMEVDASTTEALLFAASRIIQRLDDVIPSEQRRAVLPLINRIVVADEETRVTVVLAGLFEAARLAAPDDLPTASLLVDLVAPTRLVRRTREVRLTVPPNRGSQTALRDPGLIKLVVTAHAARKAFEGAEGRSLPRSGGRRRLPA